MTTIENIKNSKYLVIACNHIVKSRLIVVVDSLTPIPAVEKARESYELKCHTAQWEFTFTLCVFTDNIYVVAKGIEYLFRVKKFSNNMLEFLQAGDKITFLVDDDEIVVKIADYQEKHGGRFLCQVKGDEKLYTMSTILKKYGGEKIKGFTSPEERYIAPSLVLCHKLAKER